MRSCRQTIKKTSQKKRSNEIKKPTKPLEILPKKRSNLLDRQQCSSVSCPRIFQIELAAQPLHPILLEYGGEEEQVLLCVTSATKYNHVGVHACKRKQNYNINHMQYWQKLNKSINHKPDIKINSNRTIGFLIIKTSKQDPTWLYFDKLFYLYFLIIVIYSVIARTKRMKCQNKTRAIVRTSLYVIPNNKCGVRTNQNKGQTHIIICRTRYYYT
jgi:hypothetical protein